MTLETFPPQQPPVPEVTVTTQPVSNLDEINSNPELSEKFNAVLDAVKNCPQLIQSPNLYMNHSKPEDSVDLLLKLAEQTKELMPLFGIEEDVEGQYPPTSFDRLKTAILTTFSADLISETINGLENEN